MAVPVRSAGSPRGSAPGLTVAIWGNLEHSISAMRFPLNAGRVMTILLPSNSICVQSAVRPVSSAAARRGATSLPMSVAAIRMEAGTTRSEISARHSE